MGTLLRFGLQGGRDHEYRAAYAVLARLGYVAVEGPALGYGAGACRPFPAAVVGEVPGDPAAQTRAAFLALQEARLRPIGVAGRAVDANFARAAA